MPLGELALKRIPLLNLVGPPFHAKLVMPGKTEGRVVSTALESTNPESPPPPPFVSGFGFLGCDGVGEGPGANLLDCWSEHTGGELGGQRKAAGGKVGSRWASGKVDAGHSLTAGRTAERRARGGSEACRVPHRKCLFEALIVGLGLPERASRGRLRQETGTRSSPGLPGSREGRGARGAAGPVPGRSSSSSSAAAARPLSPAFFQNQVEAADRGGLGAAGRGRELLRSAEDVSVALFLPPKPAGQHGQHHGGRGGRGHVQQHVPDSSGAPPAAAAAAGAPRAHPRPRARGTAGPQPSVQPHPRHPASPVRKGTALQVPIPPRTAAPPLPAPGQQE